MTLHLFILCVMFAAIFGTLADLLHMGLRKLWKRHQELRALRRTAALCRLYGFCSPLDDDRSSISLFRKIHRRS